MSERETINSLIEMNKKDSNCLAAFEALGKVIEELKSEVYFKNIRIAELEKELAKVKGGSNAW